MDYGEIFEFQNNGWVSVTDYNEAVNIGEQIKQIEGIAGYTTRDENRDTINSYMSSISVMTLAVKCFAIILAVVVLYNLALLNFKERNRDIATMKVLGFNQLEIMMSLIIGVNYNRNITWFVIRQTSRGSSFDGKSNPIS